MKIIYILIRKAGDLVAGFSKFKSSSFKLGISLTLLFTVIIGSFYIVTYSLSQEENVSHMINVAGRERLLTEEMSKEAIRYVFMEGIYTKKGLQESIDTFEKNFYGLMNGSDELGLVKLKDKKIQAQLQKTMEIWKDVKEDYHLLLTENDKEQQQSIVSNINLKSIEQIESLDKLVSLIEQSDRDSFQGLNSEKLVLIISNVLLIIVLFVVWLLFKNIKISATHDDLTHLTNRRKFEYELHQAIRKQNSVAVLFIDLDRFKYVNDTLGHSIGDQLIKAVARRLKDIVDKDAIVSRQGGDEFTILVNYRDRSSIENLAKEMIDRIKQPYMIEQKEILITCSIGISIYPEHGNDMETLMKNADVAMYWSKDKGKDGFSFYEPHMKEKSARIMQLELELRKAIDNDEFILYYQPKLDLKTNGILGCEALIRWNHPTMGMISPAEFIPLAEETGLINQIGEWVLREACLQNRKWLEEGYTDFIMAVNMSAHQFKQPTMTEMIERILHETNLEAKYLEIEITESISMLSEEVIMKQLYALKQIGVSIAIDDFGTGYSSLKYLDMLPADVLKIDKSFIDEIGRMNHHSSSLMTNAIISLAKSLNLKVVAEGIENIEQIHYLKLHNCEYGQGYLISKPLPACQLERKFMRNNEKVFLAV